MVVEPYIRLMARYVSCPEVLYLLRSNGWNTVPESNMDDKTTTKWSKKVYSLASLQEGLRSGCGSQIRSVGFCLIKQHFNRPGPLWERRSNIQDIPFDTRIERNSKIKERSRECCLEVGVGKRWLSTVREIIWEVISVNSWGDTKETLRTLR